jgi:hypothetical protein
MFIPTPQEVNTSIRPAQTKNIINQKQAHEMRSRSVSKRDAQKRLKVCKKALLSPSEGRAALHLLPHTRQQWNIYLGRLPIVRVVAKKATNSTFCVRFRLMKWKCDVSSSGGRRCTRRGPHAPLTATTRLSAAAVVSTL